MAHDEAGAAFACSEAQYELDFAAESVIKDPQPAALHGLFIKGGKESASIIERTEKTVRASGAPGAVGDLEWLAKHRAWVLKYTREVESVSSSRISITRWFRPLLQRDLGCGHYVTRPRTGQRSGN